jgi:U3 small nucleolar RNA-associated protein 14
VGGGGWGRWGGGPLYVATEKNAKIAKVHSITSRFRHEDLVKIKLFIKVHEKNKDIAFYCN